MNTPPDIFVATCDLAGQVKGAGVLLAKPTARFFAPGWDGYRRTSAFRLSAA